MANEWAVWQMRQLEGPAQVAEAFLLGHGFVNDMEAREFVRTNGAVGQVYAISELTGGPFHRLLEHRLLRRVTARGEDA